MSEDIVTRLEPVGYADPGSIRMMRAGHQGRTALVRKEDAVLVSDDFQEADIPLFTEEQLRATIAALRAENANLKTVMVAAAEEISAHWQAHCDSEGYGPQNLVRRLEEGIPSEYGYTAGAFAALRAEVERLERDAERLDWLEKNTRPLYLSSHTVVAPTTKGDGSYERREVLDGWVTSINDEPHPTPRAAIDAAIAQTKETV